MTSFLEIALSCIRRGWFVFPCKPKDKTPLVRSGFKDASNDPEQIKTWWTMWPIANVGIATGASGLTVLDIDHGINSEQDFHLFAATKGLPTTYTVRTGRRDGFGVQMYFWNRHDETVKSIAWIDEDPNVSGDIRGGTGYVMAAGSIHPDSKEPYEMLVSAPVAPVPEYVRSLKPAPKTGAPGNPNAAVVDDGGPITDHRNVHMISLLGKYRNEGNDDDKLREYAEHVNDTRMQPPLSESELEKLIGNACKFALPEAVPAEILIGGKSAPVVATLGSGEWRGRYHTFEEMRDVQPPSFLIDGFLQVDSITALAAPVAQRKSLIALAIAGALCTGEALFEKFAVTKKPTRVLYLCPEMGLASFTKRLKDVGLLEYVGKTLFCQTMNSERLLTLDELTDEELSGAVVIVDTVVRYVEGDENSSEHMRAFAQSVFRMKKAMGGTGAVLLLHHSSKGTKESTELTLENAMRGSGELGAFVTSCWATRMQEPDDPYKSRSYLKNVKQRDFESDPFEVEVVEGHICKFRYVEQPNGGKAVLAVRVGVPANRDGMDEAAWAMTKSHPELSGPKMSALLLQHGIKRSKDWVNKRRYEDLQANGGNPDSIT